MCKQFEDNRDLIWIDMDNIPLIHVGWHYGEKVVKTIEIVFETGQCAGVPWATVTTSDGEQTKFNLAFCRAAGYSKYSSCVLNKHPLKYSF